MRFAAIIFVSLLLNLVAPPFTSAQAAPQFTGTLYYTNFNGGLNVNKVDYSYDDVTHSFSLTNQTNVAEVNGADGIIFAANGNLLVGGQSNPVVHELTSTGTSVNDLAAGTQSFHLALDPSGNYVYTSSFGGNLDKVSLTSAPSVLNQPVSGDDSGVTQLAFAPNGNVFYVTGQPNCCGNLGLIDLQTNTTTRLFSNVMPAHGLIFDPYTGLMTFFGEGHTGTMTQTGTNLKISGQPFTCDFDQGSVDGKGHALVAGCNQITLLDYRKSGDITNPDFVQSVDGFDAIDDTAPLVGLGSAAQPPSCTLSIQPSSGTAPLMVSGTASCQPGSSVITSATLDWGDGSSDQLTCTAPPSIRAEASSSGCSFQGSHTYQKAMAKPYVATVTATDANGLQGSASQRITVTQPAPPTCTLSFDKTSGSPPLMTNATAGCQPAPNGGFLTSATLDWGDGTPSMQFGCDGNCPPGPPATVPHTYAKIGTFTATMSTTDSNGLKGSASQTITVVDSTPKCTLGSDRNSGPAPLTVAFHGSCTDAGNDLGEGGMGTLNFGDNTSQPVSAASFSNVSHQYANPGTFQVTYTSTDSSQHTGTATETITVAQPVDSTPKCRVASDKNSGTAPLTVVFQGSCTDAGNDLGEGSTGTLNFGDNTSQPVSAASFSNVSHQYANPGIFQVTYTSTDFTQHTGTATETITVSQPAPPTCNFTFDKNSGPAPLMLNATASCTDSQNDMRQGSINWGDGSSTSPLSCEGSCSFTGPHTYQTPGMFTATVTATNAAGQSGTASQTVKVSAPVDSTPKCQLNSDTQNGPAPLTVNFTGSCTDATNDLSASGESLNFDDGTPAQPGSLDLSDSGPHTYTKAGTYKATLTAIDKSGKSGSASVTITVVAAPDSTPMCSLTSDVQSGQAPLTVKFTGNCADATKDLLPPGESLNFGDGTPPLVGVTSGTHTFASAGTFPVTLTAKDNQGLTGKATLSIVVTAAQPPTCTLAVNPTTGPAPLAITATGSCTDPQNQLTATTLDFGDGTTQTAPSGMHTYASAGTFTVTITGTDKAGLKGSASQTVTVSTPIPVNTPPTCTLMVSPLNGPAPLQITATGSCTDAENNISTTTLSFGDGVTQSAPSGSHTYSSPGTFTVTLTAVDAGGLSGSAMQTVTVTGPAPFSPDVFVGVSGGNVQEYAPDGSLVATHSTGLGGTVAGIAFDKTGNLYAVDLTAGNISKFDPTGNLIGNFGGGYNCQPEMIVFDGAGNAYVGQQGCSHQILKFDPNGNLVQQFQVATENTGSDDLALSADECTMLYTSEGPSVLRFDVCKGQQLPPFATGLKKALVPRILPDGSVLVSEVSDIVRLSPTGQPMQRYTAPGEQCWYALAVDQHGSSFWAADFCSSNIYQFDLASGNQLAKFNTGTPNGTVFGLGMAGSGLNVAGVGNVGTLTASPQSATVTAGQPAKFTIALDAGPQAAGLTFNLSCAGLPAGGSCSFSPPSVVAQGSAVTSTLTINTGTTVAVLHHETRWIFASLIGFFPAFVLLGTAGPRRRRVWFITLAIVCLSALMSVGCSGGRLSGNQNSTPVSSRGAFNVIVVGTSGQMQASTTVQLNVQ